MKKPNLAGVIDAKDVHVKGGGSFKAKYMAWAKIAQLLHEKASDWEFHLTEYQGKLGEYVHPAPDGTGYLMCHFTGPENQKTSDFPFPIMDSRNNPIKVEQISARAFTDSHRRALCAASAFHFSLGYELWAKEELDELGIDQSTMPTQTQPATIERDPPLSKEDREELLSILVNLRQNGMPKFQKLETAYRKHFPDCGERFSDHIQEPKHRDFILSHV